MDLYLSSTNAVTETEILVNLNMWGNRASAITFGPKNVIIMAGRNKLASDLEDAMRRVKRVEAPTLFELNGLCWHIYC